MTAKTTPRLKCYICGRRKDADEMLYSVFSHGHYCADTYKCQRRAKKAARS